MTLLAKCRIYSYGPALVWNTFELQRRLFSGSRAFSVSVCTHSSPCLASPLILHLLVIHFTYLWQYGCGGGCGIGEHTATMQITIVFSCWQFVGKKSWASLHWFVLMAPLVNYLSVCCVLEMMKCSEPALSAPSSDKFSLACLAP